MRVLSWEIKLICKIVIKVSHYLKFSDAGPPRVGCFWQNRKETVQANRDNGNERNRSV